jgi:hypothetical protein
MDNDPLQALTEAIQAQGQRTAARMGALGEGFGQLAQSIAQVAQVAMAPKRAIRGKSGQIEGVETVLPGGAP